MPRHYSARPYSERQSKPKSPLDRAGLQVLALAYLGRYATTRAKLRDYLSRKVRERGWEADGAAPIDALVERCAELGYVDDAAFATMRGAALGRRGFGERRVAQVLHAAGIDNETAAPAREAAREFATDAALDFARRKRIGPFAREDHGPDRRRRALATMLRAGHEIELARRIAFASPGDDLDLT